MFNLKTRLKKVLMKSRCALRLYSNSPYAKIIELLDNCELVENANPDTIAQILKDHDSEFLYSLKSNGYLYDLGWFNSLEKKESVNLWDQPIPWVTYPFIDFILPRLKKNMNIFEFGSGNSTLFYSQYVNSVTTVEHDFEWYEKMKRLIPENVSLSYKELIYDGNYCRTAIEIEKKFEIICVDGRDRVNCLVNSISALKDNGVIVLDDSERTHYSEGCNTLERNGFRRIDFWGVAPEINYKKCTSVFYKDHNSLGL